MNQIEIALLAFCIVICHVYAFGLAGRRLAGVRFHDHFSSFGITTGVGLTLLGMQMWILGYLSLWKTTGLLLSFVCCLTFLLSSMPPLGRIVNLVRRGLRRLGSLSASHKLLLIVTFCMFALVVAAGLRPPGMTDEVDYHWAAPIAWASTGSWVKVPFRYMNGPCLTELTYLVSALFGSNTAAHWTHTLFFVALVASCMGIARRCGGSATATAAACFATPVLVNQAPLAFSDDALAALLVASFAAVYCARALSSPRHWLGLTALVTVLFAGAISIKPVLAFLALPSVWFALYRSENFASNSKLAKKCGFLLLTCLILVSGLWLLQTHGLTGKFFDSKGVVILGPNESLANHIEAVGKIPSISSVLTLPLVPFITPFLGQQEPYGGRTGLISMPFLLVLFLFRNKLSTSALSKPKTVLYAALLYFLLLGLFTVRTRYLSFAWALSLPIATLPFALVRSDHIVFRKFIACAFFVAVLVGMLDSAHVLLHDRTDLAMRAVIPKVSIPSM